MQKNFLRLFTLGCFCLISPTDLIDNKIHAEENDSNVKIQQIEIFLGQDHKKTEMSQLKFRLKTKEGAIFSQQDFDDDLKMLSNEYETVEPQVSLKGNTLQIRLYLVQRPKIQAVIWQGNDLIKTRTLEKEFNITPGMIYDEVQLQKAVNKIKNYYLRKGYFESSVDSKIKKDKDGLVDITVVIQEGKPGVIDEIRFTNFTPEEIEEITDHIGTKKYSFFTSWFTQSGTLKPDVFNNDELIMLNVLRKDGFADAIVDSKISKSGEKDRIIIELTARKGEKYFVNDIVCEGNKIFSNEEIFKSMPLKKGDIYSADRIREATRALYDFYGRRGYIDASIVPEAKLKDGEHLYNVNFNIEEGDRYRIGLIKVLGNTRTQANVILHENLLIPGEYFDSSLTHKTEERLRNIGYFTHVNVYPVKSGNEKREKAHFRDVHIEVEENRTTAHFKTSIAYSTTESFIGTVGLSESNFCSRGIPKLFSHGFESIRGGGEYLSLEASVGLKLQSYTLSWTKPYFLDTNWIIGMDLNKSINEYSSKDYTIRSYGADLYARYPINAFMKFGSHYRLVNSFIKLGNKVKKEHNNHELRKESGNGGLISAIGTELLYDSTDHPLTPRRGLKSSLIAELAGLGGDHSFVKLGYLNTGFWSPFHTSRFILRGNVQFIKTLFGTRRQDMPLSERFYTGGEHSIRGYVFNRVGPKFRDKSRTIRGGFSDILLSGEFEQYLHKRLDAFAFFDAGNVYFDEFHIDYLKYSAGYGIKLKISEHGAPLIIGMGYPLNPSNNMDVKRFFISFGTSF